MLPSPVLRWGVVPAVCRVPAVLPSLRASLARLLATSCFPGGFVALHPFSLFALLPGMHFFPASTLVCVSVFFFAGSSFSLVTPCETKEGWGYVVLRRLGAVVVQRWHHVRCGVAAYNIPAFALVSTCVRTLLPLRAIPWCAYVSLPVPGPFRVLFVVVPLYSLCKKGRAWAGAPFPTPLPAPWLVPHLCWSRLVARVGRAWCVSYLHSHRGLVFAHTSFFCSFRSLLLSCARRGITW